MARAGESSNLPSIASGDVTRRYCLGAHSLFLMENAKGLLIDYPYVVAAFPASLDRPVAVVAAEDTTPPANPPGAVYVTYGTAEGRAYFEQTTRVLSKEAFLDVALTALRDRLAPNDVPTLPSDPAKPCSP